MVEEMARVRAFYRRMGGSKPRFDLMELRACARCVLYVEKHRVTSVLQSVTVVHIHIDHSHREGKLPPVAEGVAAAVAEKKSDTVSPGPSSGGGEGAAISVDATNGGEATCAAVALAAAARGHSHYGCPSLLAKILASPDVLFPPMQPSA